MIRIGDKLGWLFADRTPTFAAIEWLNAHAHDPFETYQRDYTWAEVLQTVIHAAFLLGLLEKLFNQIIMVTAPHEKSGTWMP